MYTKINWNELIRIVLIQIILGLYKMSELKMDRRIIRTRRMIRDAFTELMEEKGFDGVTVRDLAEKANINRGTFYLHYQDKYDLMEQSEREILNEIEEMVKEFNKITSKQESLTLINQQEPHPFLLKLFEYISENSDFMKVIIGPKGDPAFQVKLKEIVRLYIHEKTTNHLSSAEMIVPLEYLSAFVTSAYLGVIQQWLENGMEKSHREIALVLMRMMVLGPVHFLTLKDQGSI